SMATRAVSPALTAVMMSSVIRRRSSPSLGAATNIRLVAHDAMTDEALAARFHSASLHLLRRLAQEDRALGISAPRLSALSVLVFGGPRTIGALASAEGVTPPTMTRLVAGMVAD